MQTVKERKKVARLKKEIKQLEDKAYKIGDGWMRNEDRFNGRYEAKVKELNKLTKK